MSDNVPNHDAKKRAELISGVLTTVLEKEGYESAVAQTRKFFANSTPQQMEEMKSHLTSLVLEFMIMAGFYKDRDP